MGLITYVKLLLLLLSFYASVAIAGYGEQSVVIEGAWGNGETEFGIYYEDMRDDLPERLFVTTDGRIIIRDIVNGRRKIYSNGQLNKITNCVETPVGDWNEECNILGDYLFTNKDGNIWTKDGGKYKLTAPTGELLATYDEKPLELGVVRKTTYQNDGSGQHTIEYEDRTYRVSSPVAVAPESFVRDTQGFLYGIAKSRYLETSEYLHYRVYRFDSCGKTIGSLDLPENNIETIDISSPPYEAYQTIIHAEYGPPVIGPDGSVYCWKRTPDTYSILKWAWIDDPADPQPGPDAPTSLTVTPSSDGLNLVWVGLSSGCVDGFEIERATSAGGVSSRIATTAPDVFSYNDTSALPGITYFYKVRATSGGWYSPYSAEVNGVR
jgi:hypothetical protein